MGCFSRPQMPLLPQTITTGRRWRTRVSMAIREDPAAPAPTRSSTWAEGRARAAGRQGRGDAQGEPGRAVAEEEHGLGRGAGQAGGDGVAEAGAKAAVGAG